ncbi:Hypothetical predicted protein [Prunus dulcis]|uniref:Uncharacterized protein n=1 Tax=Prunus dulcis TaxID=3755 RepID=A0A5E4GGR0_PRUDU|nr:Hypothetical predicted protein [Prunus dulcis]
MVNLITDRQQESGGRGRAWRGQWQWNLRPDPSAQNQHPRVSGLLRETLFPTSAELTRKEVTAATTKAHSALQMPLKKLPPSLSTLITTPKTPFTLAYPISFYRW